MGSIFERLLQINTQRHRTSEAQPSTNDRVGASDGPADSNIASPRSTGLEVGVAQSETGPVVGGTAAGGNAVSTDENVAPAPAGSSDRVGDDLAAQAFAGALRQLFSSNDDQNVTGVSLALASALLGRLAPQRGMDTPAIEARTAMTTFTEADLTRTVGQLEYQQCTICLDAFKAVHVAMNLWNLLMILNRVAVTRWNWPTKKPDDQRAPAVHFDVYHVTPNSHIHELHGTIVIALTSGF